MKFYFEKIEKSESLDFEQQNESEYVCSGLNCMSSLLDIAKGQIPVHQVLLSSVEQLWTFICYLCILFTILNISSIVHDWWCTKRLLYYVFQYLYLLIFINDSCKLKASTKINQSVLVTSLQVARQSDDKLLVKTKAYGIPNEFTHP